MVVREETGARETIDSYKETSPPVTPHLNIKTSQNVLLFFPSEFMLHKDFAVCDSAF